jgi:hypothetical protein
MVKSEKGKAKNDGLVENPEPVTPAEAGVQNRSNILDSCFRRNDEIDKLDFLRVQQK